MYETEDLTEAIIFTLFGIVLLILSALFITNYLISKRLWQPFYQTLQNLSGFKITQKGPLVFDGTDISEFNQLQEHLSDLTDKVRRDYQSLKSFTENASHELQTPLSVIGSNLEMLIQVENLTENQLQRISKLIDELRKVSKLNQTLLLLTKIENRQFGSVELVNVSEIIKQKLLLLETWISHKNITLQTEVQEKVFVEVNSYLLDVLLNNILSNAIRHNEPNGQINLKLSNGFLIISNTGIPLLTNPKELFGRFQKDKSDTDSIGLGLSIVKQICETYGFDVDYKFEANRHTVSILF
jgi:signal transduction histidine kinase